MNAAGCPTDRGELLSLLTDRPPEHLARHVRDCTVCTEELAELRAAQSLIPLTHEGAPSERVRAHVMAHAERAVSTGRHLPWVGSSRERATIVAAVTAFAAVGLGQVRGAFPGVGATTLGVAALLLAVLWALALLLITIAVQIRSIDGERTIGACRDHLLLPEAAISIVCVPGNFVVKATCREHVLIPIAVQIRSIDGRCTIGFGACV